MNRTWLMVALFLLLGGGAYYALQVKKNRDTSRVSPDMEFAVKSGDDIGKIFLADRRGHTVTLERKDDYWLLNGKHRARPTAMQLLLQTLTQVNVYYVPPKAAVPVMVNTIAAEGIKVEVYDRGNKLLKQYYVGGVTNDEGGTVMQMEGSEQPYVTHIPGFVGQLRVRFFTDEDEWRDRAVFVEKPEQIQSVSVEYPQQKKESFRLEKIGQAQYEVKPFFSTTPVIHSPQRKGVPEAYLLQFERMVAEAFENENPIRDSVEALVPFAIVNLKRADGSETTAKFWPVAVKRSHYTDNNYVVRYFTALGDDFYLTQEKVFGPVFRGYSFFFEGTPRPPALLQ